MPNVYPRKGLPDNSVYAHEGEKVYCENGHHLATFSKTVFKGGSPDGELSYDMEGLCKGATSCPGCDGKVVYGFGIYYFEEE